MTVQPGIRVTMAHLRAEGLCANGTRGWFARYDREFLRRLCREGLPVAELEATADAFALRVAARARREAGQ